MGNPKHTAVASAALALLTGPRIPYVKGGETLAGMDCQGLVEYCVRECGGKMSYSGSNDMFRNACSWVGTLSEAKAQGKLLPGAVLFILEAVNSDTPQKYRTDGIGDASHIGLYCGDKAAEVVHATGSKGCVCASTLKNAWTHAALLKAVDYGTQLVTASPTAPSAALQAGQAVVVSPTLRLRKSMSTASSDNVIKQMTQGDKLVGIVDAGKDAQGNPWVQGGTSDGKHKGYAMVRSASTGEVYLQVGEDANGVSALLADDSYRQGYTDAIQDVQDFVQGLGGNA